MTFILSAHRFQSFCVRRTFPAAQILCAVSSSISFVGSFTTSEREPPLTAPSVSSSIRTAPFSSLFLFISFFLSSCISCLLSLLRDLICRPILFDDHILCDTRFLRKKLHHIFLFILLHTHLEYRRFVYSLESILIYLRKHRGFDGNIL